jgi:hypothetical protein
MILYELFNFFAQFVFARKNGGKNDELQKSFIIYHSFPKNAIYDSAKYTIPSVLILLNEFEIFQFSRCQ